MSEDDAGTAVAQQQLQPSVSVPPSATFTIQPPEPFNFAKPQEWEKWIRRFERFRLASNLHVSSQANQVNTLIYCMGDEADDVLRGQPLSEAQRHEYETVKETFNRFFVPKKNVIYERARFNQRVQQPNEPVDNFITALYALAENCNYGALHDELLRDRLVVGLRDSTLSERMQLDRDLTLEKAINMARQSEVIKKQQTDLRGEAICGAEIDAVAAKTNRTAKQSSTKFKTRNFPKHASTSTWNKNDKKPCQRCGKTPDHGKWQCPAKDVSCHTCRKKGHFSKMCKTAKTVHAIEAEEYSESSEPWFLGTVETGQDAWDVELFIRHHKVKFKIDTGADVTVIPESVFREITKGAFTLDNADKPLLGPGGSPLSVIGMSYESLSKGEVTVQENVYVVKDLHTALLGWPAILKLNLVARLDSVDASILKKNVPKVVSRPRNGTPALHHQAQTECEVILPGDS
ncbi:hypothetical protein QQF64_000261 [Cirrhinus molitorella]|uniref:Peptidase A2 domain-containing protein n=1 Tax=Cirrhinus molitorella TaxID=172907 RepID=A0ABR3NWQ3_9TELE